MFKRNTVTNSGTGNLNLSCKPLVSKRMNKDGALRVRNRFWRLSSFFLWWFKRHGIAGPQTVSKFTGSKMLKDAKGQNLEVARENASQILHDSVDLAKSLVLFLLFSVGLVEAGAIDWPKVPKRMLCQCIPSKKQKLDKHDLIFKSKGWWYRWKQFSASFHLRSLAQICVEQKTYLSWK